MSGFSGKYYYTLDPKGRIIIPAPFREIISANYGLKLHITSDLSAKCLHVYPQEEWARLEEKVRTFPRMDEAVEFYMRKFIGSAVETEMDRQGRLLIPAAHREDSGINSEVVIVGLIERIELWDRKLWDEEMDTSKVDIKAIKSRLSGFGL